jgi:hypothetical protein
VAGLMTPNQKILEFFHLSYDEPIFGEKKIQSKVTFFFSTDFFCEIFCGFPNFVSEPKIQKLLAEKSPLFHRKPSKITKISREKKTKKKSATKKTFFDKRVFCARLVRSGFLSR